MMAMRRHIINYGVLWGREIFSTLVSVTVCGRIWNIYEQAFRNTPWYVTIWMLIARHLVWPKTFFLLASQKEDKLKTTLTTTPPRHWLETSSFCCVTNGQLTVGRQDDWCPRDTTHFPRADRSRLGIRTEI
ncbi:hypothetical protein J3458_003440 [Metarhizium acridum]|uniref:uncharacterized protein n=1 Tax=Metarhizium acridum TaxID=92637 RepID=UPI001C6B6D8A|nr:hypothetical protein J3458_003440 [Metarhizium acridum]